MRFNRPLTPMAALLMLLLSPVVSNATWSIVAVDSKTKEVGIAGASCTDFVFGIAGVAPGRGVIVAQAMSNMAAKRLGVKMLAEGASPRQVIAAVTRPDFDSNFDVQQYGVAALGFGGRAAAYTGENTDDWKGSVQGHGVSVQGNILTDARVVSNALAAFGEAARNREMSLADRLMAALEAGASEGGDSRCGSQKARSAFIVVARPEDEAQSPSLRINILGQKEGGANPIKLLRKEYDEWRRSKR